MRSRVFIKREYMLEWVWNEIRDACSAHHCISKWIGESNTASYAATLPLENSKASVPMSAFSAFSMTLNKTFYLLLTWEDSAAWDVCEFSSVADKQRQHHMGTLPRIRAETGWQAEKGPSWSRPRLWSHGGLLMNLAHSAVHVDRFTWEVLDHLYHNVRGWFSVSSKYWNHQRAFKKASRSHPHNFRFHWPSLQLECLEFLSSLDDSPVWPGLRTMGVTFWEGISGEIYRKGPCQETDE